VIPTRRFRPLPRAVVGKLLVGTCDHAGIKRRKCVKNFKFRGRADSRATGSRWIAAQLATPSSKRRKQDCVFTEEEGGMGARIDCDVRLMRNRKDWD
jgi:hypothetical protein